MLSIDFYVIINLSPRESMFVGEDGEKILGGVDEKRRNLA